MKVTQHLQEAKRTLFSIEILPPLKGENIQEIYATMDAIIAYEPSFIDVTYHREEYVFRDAGNGLLKKHTVRKRPGTVGICAALLNKYQIDTIPHIICGGFTKQETEDALIDLHFLGIDNVLLLRGDAIKSEGRFVAEPEGNQYAKALVQQVVSMNQGKYLDPDLSNVQHTDFCIGVAGYPEKHFESPNNEMDIQNLKRKVEAGAEYIVTQMFFDNQKYFSFVENCRAAGINVPIIPGLKPLSTSTQLNVLPHYFHIDIPQALTEQVLRAKSKEEVEAIGIDWCVAQSKELKDAGVPCLHYYTIGKVKAIAEIAKQVF